MRLKSCTVRTAVLIATLSTVMFHASPALPQDSGRVGLVIGYPVSVGVIWQITDRIAVRPDIEFGGGSSKFDIGLGGGTSTTDSWHVGIGVSALLYMGKWEGLRAYVSPRASYTHSSTTIESSAISITFPIPTPITIRSTTMTTGTSQWVSGSFGAQYSLHRKFSAFGEVGFGYRHGTSKSRTSSSIASVPPPSDARPTTNSWGTTAGAGFIFHF